MTSITINIPNSYSEILDDMSDTLYVEALNLVAKEKLRSKERELDQISKKISQFEKKYKCNYDEFEKQMSDSLKAHDDWIEWSYLIEIKSALDTLVQKLKLFFPK